MQPKNFIKAAPAQARQFWPELRHEPAKEAQVPRAVIEKALEIMEKTGKSLKDAAFDASMKYLRNNKPKDLSRADIETVPEQRRKGKPRISKEKILKIGEAHAMGLTINKAAEYANVHRKTVEFRWREEGKKPNYRHRVENMAKGT